VGEALQAVDLPQTTEIDALAVVVRLLVELHSRELALAPPLPAEQLLQEGRAQTLLPLVEIDRSVTP
jgi:hypothetical protein